MKTRRQAAILSLIDHHAIASQEDLRRRLRALGFSVTQATLSRDIRDLALVKNAADGAYHRPGADVASPVVTAARLQHAVAEYVTRVDRSQQLVVVRTGAGQAQPLAAAVDASQIEGVIGTVAGDDTVLVVCRDASRAAHVERKLNALAAR